MIRFILFRALTFGLLVGGVWALGLASFWITVVFMTPQSPDMKTDGIVVLTGGENRVRVGIDLFQQKKSDRLLISGVNPKTKLSDLVQTSGFKMHDLPCCIDLGFDAEDTVGNAVETRRFVDQYHLKTIRMITATYHMPRAFLEMKRATKNVIIYRHPVSTTQFNPLTRNGVTLILTEYHKTFVTLLHFIRDFSRQGRTP